MVGKKSFYIAFILLCFCGCVENTTKIVQAEFLCVTDSKPKSDSLYAEWSKEGHFVNPREIELCYVIHNDTYEKLYLPIHTTFDSIAKSFINVYFMEKTDTIIPQFYVKKNPYNSNYICKGDSMFLYIEVFQFQKWGKNEVDVNADIDTLIKRLHVEYIQSPEDKKEPFDIPTIEFGESPQSYYEIPKDPSVLEKIHRDRVLVRTAQRGKL